MTSTVGGAMGGGAPIQQLPTQGGATTPPTKDPGTLGGGGATGIVYPDMLGPVGSALGSLINALHGVVTVLNGGTVPSPPMSTTPPTPPAFGQIDAQRAWHDGTGPSSTYALTTMSGSNVTIARAANGTFSITNPTGRTELVQLLAGEPLQKFDATGRNVGQATAAEEASLTRGSVTVTVG